MLSAEKGVERFDLIAWQKARSLTPNVYRATRRQPLSRGIGLAAQLQRAAVSVMANIAEGFERSRPGEFHQFLSTAKASCAELRSHLYVALDIGYLDEPTFQALSDQAEEVSRIIGGLRAAVDRRRTQHRHDISTQH